MKKLFLTTYIGLMLFIVGGSPSFAQSTSLELTPKNPEPNSQVTIRINSATVDVNTAFITWQVDGVTIVSGTGERQITVATGAVGEKRNVVAIIESKTGYKSEQRISLTPASVILLQEAPRSHVPSFYEGRSFAARGGLVRITAIPSISDDGVPLSPSDLSYTWYVSGEAKPSLSGIGKQSAEVRVDYLRSSTEVKLVVRSPLGVSVSETIKVSPHLIEPALYRYNEILGADMAKALEGRVEITKTTPVRLEPYFVSSKEDMPPVYKWLLDGFDITPVDGVTLGLTPKENSYGSKKLTVRIQGPDKRLQSAEKSFEILFDTRK